MKKFKFFITSIFVIIIFSLNNTSASIKILTFGDNKTSNYFLGVVLLNENKSEAALKHFNKVRDLKNTHFKFNQNLTRTFVNLGKVEEAQKYLKNLSDDDANFFEANLLLGLYEQQRGNFKDSESYFMKLNFPVEGNLYYENLLGNILTAWSKANQGKDSEAKKYLEAIPAKYEIVKTLQRPLLSCFFKKNDTEAGFEKFINSTTVNFARYRYLYLNYLVRNKKFDKAAIVIEDTKNQYENNLLVKQAFEDFKNKKFSKIENTFNCKIVDHNLSEVFYIMSSVFAEDQANYKLSNFYLSLSQSLNSKFFHNKVLKVENFISTKNYEEAIKLLEGLSKEGDYYKWFSIKKETLIKIEEKEFENALNFLEKEFGLFKHRDNQILFEIAGIYMDQEKYEKAIFYYSKILENSVKDNIFLARIYDRRGACYERSGKWIKAEKDLKKSLDLHPDQAYVLNYLAYSWLEKNKKIDEAYQMLKKANNLKKDNPYILDSLGWALNLKGNYIDAKFYIEEALTYLPSDPVISDHYGDILWKLGKKIQARYFWKYALVHEDTNEEKIKIIKNKILKGI
tara:strand:+ start:795 stop:2498 length:1704 start_codon:yes stop_codon:yes gene_type:complete